MNGRREEAEESINVLEDRVMESNPDEQKREKRIMQNENRLREIMTPSNVIMFML